MGTINVLDKSKADELLALGFQYIVQKLADKQKIYCFVDTPELRKVVSSQFDNNDFYINKNMCF